MKVVVFRHVNPTIPVDEGLLQKHWSKIEEIPGIRKVVYVSVADVAKGRMEQELADADALVGVPQQVRFFDEKGNFLYPRLRYIGILSHGYDRWDPVKMGALGVALSNTAYGNHIVAQYAMALLLEVCHRIGLHNSLYKDADWEDPACKARAFYAYTPQLSLNGKTMGIIGLGGIGGCLAQMARGMGMKVISSSRHKPQGCEFVDLVSQEELLRRSDVVSLNAPSSASTIDLINRNTLKLMKKTAILINTARGNQIVEEDLADALENGEIAFAALDTLREEPPKKKSRLLMQKNCIVTGHIAWMGVEEFYHCADLGVENFGRYMRGDYSHIVNRQYLRKR